MKRLWKSIPPCMSDCIGFEAVMNQLNGYGIIDDSSRYKPISQGGSGRDRERIPGGRPEYSERRPDYPERRGGHGHGHGHGGGPGRRGGRGGEVHIFHSNILNEDIIYGTEKKVLEAASQAMNSAPDFLLLSYAPSSSMISSDLELCAEKIAESSGLPVAAVNIHGDKDYLYGISAALEALGKLLLTPRKTVPETLNILGCNSIDWTQEAYSALTRRLEEAGWKVCSCWGMKETTENLRNGASAQYNLVVSEAGLRLARYMESEFGIPYVAGAPFGSRQTQQLLLALNGQEPESAPADGAKEMPDTVIICEQFTGNAIRTALEARGMKQIRVLSFFEMAPAYTRPGDGKLVSEDDLKEKTAGAGLVFGAPEYRAAAGCGGKWISLPNPACASPIEPVPNRNLVDGELDSWLDSVLEM